MDPQLVADSAGNVTGAWIGTTNDFFGPHGLVIRRKPVGTASWGPPEVIDPDTGYARVAVDRAGTLTALFWRAHHLFAARSSLGDPFGTAVDLTPDLPGNPLDATLATTPDGTVIVVWNQRARTPDLKWESRVAWTQLPVGTDTWTPARFLTGPGTKTDPVILGTASDNSALIAWQGGKPGHRFHIQTRTLAAGAGAWASPVKVPVKASTRNYLLDAAINLGHSHGTMLLERALGDDTLIFSSQIQSDGTWQRPHRVQPDLPAGWSQTVPIVSARRGTTIAAWENYRTFGSRSAGLVATLKPSGRRWSSPHTLNRKTRGVEAEPVSAQAYPDGAIRAVWLYQDPESGNGGTYQLRTAVRARAGTWGPTTAITGKHVTSFDAPAVQLLPAHAADILYDNSTDQTMFTQTAPQP